MTQEEYDNKEKGKSKIQPEWKNHPTFDDLNGDKIEASAAQENHKENLLKWELARAGGKEIKARPGKSKVRPKLIRKQAEWKYPALEEPFLNTPGMFEIKPKTEEDEESAEENQLVVNYQWNSLINKTKIINDIVRTIVDEGTVIVKTGWESEEGIDIVEKEVPDYATPEESVQMMQQAIEDGSMSQEQAQAMMEAGQPMKKGMKKIYVEEETLIKNQPTYEVCNSANVYIDPTCEGIIENATFIIHEYDTSFAELKKHEYTEEVIKNPDGTKTVNTSGIYHNILEAFNSSGNESTTDEHQTINRNSFTHKDKARKKIRAFEYWGYWDIQGNGELVSIIATWVGSTIIRLEENPFPHKRLPFSLATYMPVRLEIHGEPDAEILQENQESIGKMTRAAHDITSTQAIGQEFIDERLFSSPSQKNSYENGNTVYTASGMNIKNSIYRNTVESVPNSVFQMISSQQSDAESLTATKSFGSGISGQALGTSVAGIRSALDATSKRELSILRRISNMLLLDMLRMTIAMNQAYMPEEQIIRLTNKKFVSVRRDNLGGSFDLEIAVSTPEKDNDTADKIMTLMQTNAANMHPSLAALHYEKIAKLWKLPDLADKIKNFKPEPDPVTEQIKQLELENAMLSNAKLKKDLEEADSRITERISRTEENAVDIENKTTQAELRRAQSAKLRSEADRIDLEFANEMTGRNRQHKREDDEYSRLSKQELQNQKQIHELQRRR